MKTLHDLFIYELQEVCSAAEYLITILKRMFSAATDPAVKELMDTYYYQAEYQEKKLNEYLAASIEPEKRSGFFSMRSLRDYGVASMRWKGSALIRDCVLLAALNRIKHFEKGLFGTLMTLAHLLKLEEETDLLLSLKKKLGEEGDAPLKITSRLLQKEGDKKEVGQFLANLLPSHLEDEEQWIPFLIQIESEIKADSLKEATMAYRKLHVKELETLRNFSKEQSGINVVDWQVLGEFISEWKGKLSKIAYARLKDIALILFIQKIIHQNIALYEFEELLSGFLSHQPMKSYFRACLLEEKGSDLAFTALAEDSLFTGLPH